jgi:regulator of replication initiation timing
MTEDEYYTLEEQLVGVRRQLFDLKDQVDTLVEQVRMLRYDLDTLRPRS